MSPSRVRLLRGSVAVVRSTSVLDPNQHRQSHCPLPTQTLQRLQAIRQNTSLPDADAMYLVTKAREVLTVNVHLVITIVTVISVLAEASSPNRFALARYLPGSQSLGCALCFRQGAHPIVAVCVCLCACIASCSMTAVKRRSPSLFQSITLAAAFVGPLARQFRCLSKRWPGPLRGPRLQGQQHAPCGPTPVQRAGRPSGSPPL